jgi:hypothetical protein
MLAEHVHRTSQINITPHATAVGTQKEKFLESYYDA